MWKWDNTYRKMRLPAANPGPRDNIAPVHSVGTKAAASKREAFLWIVQTGLLAHFQRQSVVSNGDGDGDLFHAMLVADKMAGAVTVSRRIPSLMSAFAAAHDFLTAVLSEYEGERREEWYEHPRWTGLVGDEDRRRNAASEMQPGSGRPPGAKAPTAGRANRNAFFWSNSASPRAQSTSAAFATSNAPVAQQLVDYLQNNGRGKMADFGVILPGMSRYAIARLLRKLEAARAVHSVGYVWFPGPALPETDQRKRQPQQGLKVSRPEQKPAHQTPDGKRILRALHILRSETLDGLSLVTPKLDRNSLVRLLRELEAAGLVLEIGDQWKGIERPGQSEPSERRQNSS